MVRHGRALMPAQRSREAARSRSADRSPVPDAAAIEREPTWAGRPGNPLLLRFRRSIRRCSPSRRARRCWAQGDRWTCAVLRRSAVKPSSVRADSSAGGRDIACSFSRCSLPPAAPSSPFSGLASVSTLLRHRVRARSRRPHCWPCLGTGLIASIRPPTAIFRARDRRRPAARWSWSSCS